MKTTLTRGPFTLDIERTSCGLAAFLTSHPDDPRAVVAVSMSPRYADRLTRSFARTSAQRLSQCGRRGWFLPRVRRTRDYLFESTK